MRVRAYLCGAAAALIFAGPAAAEQGAAAAPAPVVINKISVEGGGAGPEAPATSVSGAATAAAAEAQSRHGNVRVDRIRVSPTGEPVVETAGQEAPVAAGAAATAAPATVAVQAPPPPAAAPKPPAPTLQVSIDLTSQRMTVREHGEVSHVWPISSGRAGYRTPTGTFRPQWMTRMHYSRKYDNAPMPHSVFFHGGYAIHATYATSALGRPASHGCIRLSSSNAKTFYGLVGKHGKSSTRIAIHGTARDAAPAVAQQRKTHRRSYSAASGSSYAPSARRPGRGSPSAAQPTYYAPSAKRYAWPGDAPKSRPRYGSSSYSNYR